MEKSKYWLLGIILAVLALRLFLAFSQPNFTYDSYFNLRQVEHITTTGLPSYQDALSSGGRTLIFLPFFHYFASFFDLFLPLEIVGKLLPSIFLIGLMIIVYYLAKKIGGKETGALLAALITGLLPTLFETNAFRVESLTLPLFFLAVYAFLRSSEKKFLYLFLLSFLLLSLTTTLVFLLLAGIGLYFLLSFLENKKVESTEKEVFIFSLFFYLWLQFLFFKEIFLQQGIAFLWQNIPPQIILQYFPQITLTEIFLSLSIFPALAGIFIIYRTLFVTKNREHFFMLSLFLIIIIFAFIKLLELKLALSFLGIILALFFALFYEHTAAYIYQTRLKSLKKIFIPLLLLILLFSLLPPALNTAWQQSLPTKEEVDAFRWLAENTPANSGALSLLEEGHLLTYYGQRRNLMDTNFALIPQVEQRFNDLNILYLTSFETQALSLLNKYHLQYLIFTPRAQEKYLISNFNYLNKKCFEQVYYNNVKIYQVKCQLQAQ